MRRIKVLGATLTVVFALGAAGATSAQAAAPTCSKPFCEPTITPGVEILTKGGTHICTAGPMMIKKNTKETWLLTAGHCLAHKGEVISSKYQKDDEDVEKPIGKVTEVINSGKFDTGEIKIETAPWTAALPALIVDWETEKTLPVVGEGVGRVGESVCHEGVESGHACGIVLRTNVHPKVDGEELPEKLVETAANSDDGDSGGPFYRENAGGVAEILGTHVGSFNESIPIKGETNENSKQLTGLADEITINDKTMKVEKIIKDYLSYWPMTGVPIEEVSGVIPAGTTVEGVKEVKAKGKDTTVTVEMSAPAKAGSGVTSVSLNIGHPHVSYYEPMAQIRAVPAYAGQELLTTANEGN
jgi:hypothetical protein